jgi:CRISPR-associated protein Csx10
MQALTYTLELVEPLLIADPVSGDENSATGLNYIPGSVIRGALAHVFTNGRRVDLSDPQFKRLFFGDVLFLNAYPLIDGQRSLPVPRSWQREKGAGDNDPIFDLANGEPNNRQQLAEVHESFTRLEPLSPTIGKDAREDETADEKPTAHLYAPKRDIRVHILQLDRRKAAQKDASSVYRYEALAAGQRFAGAILARDDDDALHQLAERLPKLIKLGKSRSAGYGAVNITNVGVHSDWCEYMPMATTPSERIVVTLLSDAIVRDPVTGEYSGSLAPLFSGRLLKAFVRTCVVGGFNLAWGLPLPQARAIQAGSVFVFEHSEELFERLKAAESNGIGERRREGFGRIAINWHTDFELHVPKAEPEQDVQDVVLTKEDSIEWQLAQQMVNRIWRAQLDDALRTAISSAKLDSAPQNAQLSRMRVLAREAWRSSNSASLLDVLKKESESPKAMKRHAREQFERSSIIVAGQTQPLIKWLKALAEQPEMVWQILQIDWSRQPQIGGVKPENPDALEYAVRLIDGVLRKAIKQKAE